MHAVATNVPEHHKLIVVLNAFCSNVHLHCVTQSDYGFDDLGDVRLLLIKGGDERSIDLDLVEGEAPELTETGIPCPEVIHCNRDSEFPELFELMNDGLLIHHKHGFGHFEF